jgi:hypothetical protein
LAAGCCTVAIINLQLIVIGHKNDFGPLIACILGRRKPQVRAINCLPTALDHSATNLDFSTE